MLCRGGTNRRARRLARLSKRFRRVEQGEQWAHMLLGILAAKDVLPWNLQPGYSVSYLPTQQLNDLEQGTDHKDVVL
jgi:hypothetical protein